MQKRPKKFHSKKIVKAEDIENAILSCQNMSEKRKINLSKIRNFVLILTLMIGVGFSGFLFGRYEINNPKDFFVSLKSEFNKEEE